MKNSFIFTVLVILAVSLYLGYSDAQFRVSIGADGWRGLFPHKNSFAIFCFFSMCTFYSFRYKYRIIPHVLGIVVFGCILLSQSKTALGMVFAFFMMKGIHKFISFVRPNQYLAKKATNFTLAIVLIFIALVFYYLMAEGGVDFSGRTHIWRWYMKDLGDSIIWGMGGTTAPSDPSFVERATAYGILLSSDNSYVMIIYNLGLIGIAIYAAIIIKLISMSVSNKSPNSLTALLMIYCYIIYATMESGNKLMFSFSTMAILLAVFKPKEATDVYENLDVQRESWNVAAQRTSLQSFK